MKSCLRCGNVLDDKDTFCNRCGAPAADNGGTRQQPDLQPFITEPKEKLLCELAYSGVLFWLPLFISGKVKTAKYHANQGLWLLILSCLLCWAIQLLGYVDALLAGIAGGIFHLIYLGAFLVFFLVMAYLAVQGIRNAFAIHRGGEAEPILFFEEKAIIH